MNTQGLTVTGYPFSGTPPTVQTGANPVALSIPTTQMSARATTTATQVANLNSTSTAISAAKTFMHQRCRQLQRKAP
nr:Flagellar hook protein FlgE [Candidatus Pantoea persica]